jgi:predicted permease
MNTLLRDLRFSLRLLARTPGFTAAAFTVLALGIGANTAIFSVVRELIFSPRPYPDEAQIVQLYTQDTKNPQRFRAFSYPTYQDIREQQTTFAGVLAHTLAMVGVGEGEASRRTFAAIVSSNYFSTLGVPLVQGRGFLPEEEKPGSAAPVVIASHLYWKKSGFDPHLVGRTIRVNERQYTVVGITPEGFTGTIMLFGPELYFPLGHFVFLTGGSEAETKRTLERRDAYNLFVVGRLKPGVTAAAAETSLRALATNLEKVYPVEQKDQTFTTRPLPRLNTSTSPSSEGGDLNLLGTLLLGMAGLVLLVTCLNLTNMLLARGSARRKEIAIRLALGGGRGRIVRQLLTEGLVLSFAGGAGGMVLGLWSSRLLTASLGAHMPAPLFFRGGPDPVIFAATLAFCALATVLFALGPALKLSRGNVIRDLKEQAGEDAAPRRRWLPRNPLVVTQIALSLGLLTAAGLFIRGALKAGRVETGFKADDTVLVEVDASLGGQDKVRSLQLYRAASDRLAALPGVQSASIASIVPFGFLEINRPVQRAGVKPAPDAKPATAAEGLAFNVRWNSIGADYFTTMGLPLLRGRAFTTNEAEMPDSPPVVIIDDVLARKLWPDGDALGQRIQWAENDAPKTPGGGGGNMGGISNDLAKGADDAKSIEIVGIVPATRWELFQKEVGGHIYVPFAQGFQSIVFFQIRTAARAPGADAALFDLIRRELRSAAPGVPVFAVKTFRQHLDGNVQLWMVRIGAAMFSIFGGLALILAVVGVYGVKAYSVARRTREIGIRMALGAEPGAVLRMLLREGLVMTLSGTALGFLLALGIGRFFGRMLYQVSPVDPVAFTLAPLALTAAALLACWLPARRATKVDPIIALRSE